MPSRLVAVAWGPLGTGSGSSPTTTTTEPSSTSDCGPLTSDALEMHALGDATGTVSTIDPEWGVLRPNSGSDANVDVVQCVGGKWVFRYFDDPSGACLLGRPDPPPVGPPDIVKGDLDLKC